MNDELQLWKIETLEKALAWVKDVFAMNDEADDFDMSAGGDVPDACENAVST